MVGIIEEDTVVEVDEEGATEVVLEGATEVVVVVVVAGTSITNLTNIYRHIYNHRYYRSF